ncbi:hypothetical protein BCR39DRAFT_585669 [Naematelia encephala]|uniref:U4/U6.U5 small nuclear ribonucleoprotein 27kDa protein domain-containing protein n=1 Tax=Naematelia encephala TaxID=71784 RepID=A0A1Y2BIU8_9TREE|nr:hypothetical protein BCR39DRAFT_585669 [Naematelia encephala]
MSSRGGYGTSPRRDDRRGYERDQRSGGGGRDRSRSPRRDRGDDTRGSGGRGGYDRRERDHRGPSKPYDRPPAASYRGGRGGGRGGGYEGRPTREDDYERPLDRRAIEEGRRRREEERANGVVYTDERDAGRDGDHPNGQRGSRDTPGGSGSAAPRSNGRGLGEDGEDDGGEEGEGGEDDDAMAAMLGFGGFTTTKGKGIGQNAEGAVNVHKQRTWRQYMNRRGGFNRPLEKMK